MLISFRQQGEVIARLLVHATTVGDSRDLVSFAVQTISREDALRTLDAIGFQST